MITKNEETREKEISVRIREIISFCISQSYLNTFWSSVTLNIYTVFENFNIKIMLL